MAIFFRHVGRPASCMELVCQTCRRALWQTEYGLSEYLDHQTIVLQEVNARLVCLSSSPVTGGTHMIYAHRNAHSIPVDAGEGTPRPIATLC